MASLPFAFAIIKFTVIKCSISFKKFSFSMVFAIFKDTAINRSIWFVKFSFSMVFAVLISAFINYFVSMGFAILTFTFINKSIFISYCFNFIALMIILISLFSRNSCFFIRTHFFDFYISNLKCVNPLVLI